MNSSAAAPAAAAAAAGGARRGRRLLKNGGKCHDSHERLTALLHCCRLHSFAALQHCYHWTTLARGHSLTRSLALTARRCPSLSCTIFGQTLADSCGENDPLTIGGRATAALPPPPPRTALETLPPAARGV